MIKFTVACLFLALLHHHVCGFHSNTQTKQQQQTTNSNLLKLISFHNRIRLSDLILPNPLEIKRTFMQLRVPMCPTENETTPTPKPRYSHPPPTSQTPLRILRRRRFLLLSRRSFLRIRFDDFFRISLRRW